MKNLIKRWLGITYLEHEARDHQIQIGHIYKRLLMVQEKTRSKPRRYDEIQRAQSRRRKGRTAIQYNKGATTEETAPQ